MLSNINQFFAITISITDLLIANNNNNKDNEQYKVKLDQLLHETHKLFAPAPPPPPEHHHHH